MSYTVKVNTNQINNVKRQQLNHLKIKHSCLTKLLVSQFIEVMHT